MLLLSPKGDENMFQVKVNNDENMNYFVFKEKELNIVGHPKDALIALPNFYDLTIIPGNYSRINNPTTIEITVKNGEKTEKDEEYEYMYGKKNKPEIIYKHNGNSVNINSDLTFVYTNNCPIILKYDLLRNPQEMCLDTDIIPLTLEEYNLFYEEYLNQMKKNPTSEYLRYQENKQNIEEAKKLIKKRA